MTNTDAKPIGELPHGGLIQCTILNEPQCALYNRRRAGPCRRAGGCLGPAAQARAIARLCGFLRGGVVPHIRVIGETRWADRAAVDPRGADGDEESAVKARVAAATCPIENVPRQTRNCFHGLYDSLVARALLAIFGCHTPVRILTAATGLPTAYTFQASVRASLDLVIFTNDSRRRSRDACSDSGEDIRCSPRRNPIFGVQEGDP